MSDLQPHYDLWDEFLRVWPRERLAAMTLDDYTRAGSKDSFTYWIESRLDGLGSIWGGSAFKFGIFSRKDAEEKRTDDKLSYSDTHGWYSSLGATAQQAFERVRQHVAQVAALAALGDIDGLEAFEHLGEAIKWKVAFHYQDRQAPVIVDIFKKAPLAVFVGGTANQSMAALQKAALARRPADLGILEFGQQIWQAWGPKNLAIWKLSHGSPTFTEAERQQLQREGIAAMFGETNAPGPGDEQKGKQGKNFATVPVGTLFFLCHGNSPQLIGQFTSKAQPCAKGEGWLQRSYRVVKAASRTERYENHKKGWSPQGNTTFWQVSEEDLPEFETTLLKPYFDIDLASLAAASGLVESVIEDKQPVPAIPASASSSATPRTAPFNRIYYGPPGTGKTLKLLHLLRDDYQDSAPVSPNEWRAQFIDHRIGTLTWWECTAAALFDLGGRASVGDLLEHPFVLAKAKRASSRNVRAVLWANLQAHTVGGSETVKYARRVSPEIFDKNADSVWNFAGEWQQACADLIEMVEELRRGPSDDEPLNRYTFVTFHQSYGYEEFVEGLRPVLAENSESGEIAYEIRPGAFKQLCHRARLAPDKRFAIVIDEINRGNISKIFGELITLIELDKRAGGENAQPATLAYSGESFLVPGNVDILGTMNTADRSLALLDTALRRRFEFVPLLPDTREQKDAADPTSAPLAGLTVTTAQGSIDIRRMLERINERIEALYDRDHCIGHAYFTNLAQVADPQARFRALAEVLRSKVLPLLEEYFFEDWQKIRLVLADNQKQDPTAQFILESGEQEQDLAALFGNEHGIEIYSAKRRYRVQDGAFDNPRAYIGIYQPMD